MLHGCICVALVLLHSGHQTFTGIQPCVLQILHVFLLYRCHSGSFIYYNSKGGVSLTPGGQMTLWHDVPAVRLPEGIDQNMHGTHTLPIIQYTDVLLQFKVSLLWTVLVKMYFSFFVTVSWCAIAVTTNTPDSRLNHNHLIFNFFWFHLLFCSEMFNTGIKSGMKTYMQLEIKAHWDVEKV